MLPIDFAPKRQYRYQRKDIKSNILIIVSKRGEAEQCIHELALLIMLTPDQDPSPDSSQLMSTNWMKLRYVRHQKTVSPTPHPTIRIYVIENWGIINMFQSALCNTPKNLLAELPLPSPVAKKTWSTRSTTEKECYSNIRQCQSARPQTKEIYYKGFHSWRDYQWI